MNSESLSHGPREESVQERIARLEERLHHVEKKIGNGQDPYFTPKAEFQPVRAVVYGLVALLMTGIVMGLLALVLNHGK